MDATEIKIPLGFISLSSVVGNCHSAISLTWICLFLVCSCLPSVIIALIATIVIIAMLLSHLYLSLSP